MSEPTTRHPAQVRVWDPWIRISHWLLAGAFCVAYFVVEEPLAVHVWAGYLIRALLGIRVVWGVIGPRHARFTDFVPTPTRLRRYLGDLLRGRERRHLGHNPAGGAMVVTLLVALAATVGTGLMVYGAEEKAGPLGGWYAGDSTRLSLVAAAHADKEADYDQTGEGHEEAETLEELHEFAANVTLFLVGLHITGVVATSLRQRENLPRAMVTGRKRALEPGESA
ncbi:MAG: cytochrome b/b6 domain-containing protein [Thiohalorhabdaceae bacterium]